MTDKEEFGRNHKESGNVFRMVFVFENVGAITFFQPKAMRDGLGSVL